MKLLVITINGKGLCKEDKQKKRNETHKAIVKFLKDEGLDGEYVPLISTEPIDIKVINLGD